MLTFRPAKVVADCPQNSGVQIRRRAAAADDLIRQARRFKNRRELTRAIRLVARADVELRSSPPDKRLVLERLIYDLAAEPKAAMSWAPVQLSFES